MEPSHSNNLAMLFRLAGCLSARFQRTGDRQDLDRSTAIHRIMLNSLPHEDPDRWSFLNNLANCRLTRYQRWRDVMDLERAVELFKEALAFCPEGAPVRFAPLCNLADSMILRFERIGKIEDLDESITLLRSAVEFFPVDHPNRFTPLNDLATCLRTRFERMGIASDLDESIVLQYSILDVCPEGHPGRPMYVNNLANTLRTRFKHSRNIEDLDKAVLLHSDTLALLPEGHPDRHSLIHRLTNCLVDRFTHGGKVGDLDEAILLFRSEMNRYPEGNPERLEPSNDLADVLMTRYNHVREIKDLDEVVGIRRAVLTLCPEGHTGRSSSLYNLATTLWTRFRHTGDIKDLDEAIALHREALRLRAEGHPQRSESLNNLATSLWTRFKHSGNVEDLHESIATLRPALALRPLGHPGRPLALNNLASFLLGRFEHSGREEDLDEAISLFGDALDICVEGHPRRCMTINNLANALWTRFSHKGNVEDLDRSIELHRAALRLYPERSPGHSMSIGNLARSLVTRFQKGGKADYLDESIALYRDALLLRPQGHPSHSSALNNLAGSLFMRFTRDRKTDDLDEAIELSRSAVALCFKDHPNQAEFLIGLANSLYARFRERGDSGDFEESLQCLSRATTQKFSGTVRRLEAAQRWAAIARSRDHHTTLDAYNSALSLLQRALTIRPTLASQHDFLSKSNDCQALSMNAASYAIEKGDFTRAIELLEQGRTLLWSQMRGLRASLESLSEVEQALADRFRKCNGRLEALITSTSHSSFPNTRTNQTGPGNQGLIDRTLEWIRRLWKEQEDLIDEIRRVPGFDDFLKSPTFDVIQQAASEGPVIVINHSRHRCDALIVTSRKDVPCACVSLDAGLYSDSLELCHDLVRVRREFGVQSATYDETLRHAMKMLWDRVVCKVVPKLKELGFPAGSRIWWCPTSVLSWLPFHAAGPYDGEDRKKVYLLDEYISSYTPTLKSLITSRCGPDSGRERMLFVGDTGLPAAKKEWHAIRSRRPIDRVLFDEKASRDAVIQALKRVEWVHFACHGKLGQEPFNSYIKLFDGGLTLLDIAKARLPNAQFAFLSACHTAEQAPNFASDESLSIAAAVQFCGFRSVVGTMWQLLDRDGPILAGNTYAYLSNDVGETEPKFKRVAAAVRAAALNLRELGDEAPDGSRTEMMAERWVNLVHIGA